MAQHNLTKKLAFKRKRDITVSLNNTKLNKHCQNIVYLVCLKKLLLKKYGANLYTYEL